MIEKLKSLTESVKNTVLFILTPVVFLFGIIYYLVTSKTSLKNQLEAEKANKALDHIINEKERAKNEADKAEEEFRKLRAEYDASKPDGNGGTES